MAVTIDIEKVRARIVIGGVEFVTTGTDATAAGDIMSFSVSRSRGQPVATFRCSLSVWADRGGWDSVTAGADELGPSIKVYGGVGSSLPILFTGYVTQVTMDPHWDDQRKFILNVSGEDVLVKLKHGGKFTRRFVQKEDAYAVITGGKRREAGQMTRLRKAPAGKKGIDTINSSSGSPGGLEHSPLIKTPDPQQTSPTAAPLGKKESKPVEFSTIRFEPSHVYANAGDTLFAKVVDAHTGEVADPSSLSNLVGVGCLLCMSPSPGSFSSGQASSDEGGLEPGKETFPVSVDYGKPGDPTAKGFTFTVKADYPAKVTFIHPLSAGSCTLHFHQIPPHNHETMAQGGPAVASFDVAQL